MDEIRRKKLERMNDAREWTPEEALEDALKDIREIPAGREVKFAVFWWEKEPGDDCYSTAYRVSGMTRQDLIAMLWLELHGITNNYWLG